MSTQTTPPVPPTGTTSALVGAGPGRGAAVARRFAAEGFAIALLARTPSRLDDLVGSLRAGGTEARARAVDVRDRAALGEARQDAADDLGPVEVLQYSPAPEFLRPVLETGADGLVGPVETSVHGPAPTGTSSRAPAPAAPSAHPSPAAPTTTTSTTDALRVVVDLGDGAAVTGELDDSATARSLLQQLPLTLAFSDFAGQEKIAALPAPLSLDGAPARSDAPAMTIGYHTPSQSLVLYYDDVGTYGGIVPLGRLGDVGPLVARTGDFTATMRASG
ncbi:cyclophilin-like fold protein [Cellulomonas endophytica]|uniref:cyclophilin-like fold protein n=1 Tax=Cellulomonas endophytica TaxID=2494735 RepID=UPI0013E9768D|nr:cyclophilin-like fold protein [Cellulomonas endophytica]